MKASVGFCCLVLCACVLAEPAAGQSVWTKYPGNPVLSGDPNSSWRKALFGASVLYNSDSMQYEMWFTGAATYSGGRPCNIGYAVSTDGVSWTIHSEPVLAPGTGTWDSYTVELPHVIRESGQYKMWYTGRAVLDSIPQIGYATSPDGVTWAKHPGNPVLGAGTSAWEAGGVGSGFVMQVTGGYRMWYSGAHSSLGIFCVGCASSADGILWDRDTISNPVLLPGASPALWDFEMVAPSMVLAIGDRYYMWYTGSPAPPVAYQIGLATSTDGIEWIKHPDNPVLRPSAVGWDVWSAECGSVLLRNDTLYMWYDGGHNLGIGLATSPFTPVSISDEGTNLPAAYVLEQNYPNPFNPVTVIGFQVPVASDVRLVVCDLLGREIAVLVNGRTSAGRHEVKLDAAGLASGVYFYRLAAGPHTQSRRMLLLR